jgi:hypothetical protein
MIHVIIDTPVLVCRGISFSEAQIANQFLWVGGAYTSAQVP